MSTTPGESENPPGVASTLLASRPVKLTHYPFS
jgi:hypothetical protein